MPLSRKRGFSKTALSLALHDSGVDYLHFRELGNPKFNRSGFGGTSAQVLEAQTTFVKTVLSTPDAQLALEKISLAVQRRKTAILCFERDPTRCHRSQVLAALSLLPQNFGGDLS